MNYEPAEKPKSDLYVEPSAAHQQRALDLLEHDRLVYQLTLLERRTSRAGQDRSTTALAHMTTLPMQQQAPW